LRICESADIALEPLAARAPDLARATRADALE